MNQEDFWTDANNASLLNKELTALKKEIKTAQVVNNLENLEKELTDLETSCFLNEPYDNLNCFLEIHPGAGGTESCDWSSMLLRMYKRFCEIEDFKCEVIDEQKEDPAGIKSATLKISGLNAYFFCFCYGNSRV